MKKITIISVALLAGGVLGWTLAQKASVDNGATADESAYVQKKSVADAGESASVRALRTRVAELERMLQEARRQGEEDVSNAVAKVRAEMPRRHGPRESLEKLKETDPAKYASITNRMAKFRQRRMERQMAKMEFLASVDTSRMSKGAKATHDKLTSLLEQREQIEERLHQEGLTDEQRHEIMEELRSTDREVRKLNSAERKNLLDETAKQLGFSGDDVTEITSTVQEVIDATEGGMGGPPPPPDGGAGGPPPMSSGK